MSHDERRMNDTIRATDKVAAVLAGDERLLEVFVGASPAFAMLRNSAARRTMARLVTVEQAAKIAGIEAAMLVDLLNRASDGHPAPATAAAASTTTLEAPEAPPDGLLATPPERLVDVDVREELRAGREPLRQILAAVKSLPPGSVLRLRAIFEPAPLYAVLARQGFAHFTERLGSEDWRVWFFRDGSARGVSPSPSGDPSPVAEAGEVGEDVVVLDVRGLEPPEPMVRTLEALSTLPRGKTLVQLNVRVPKFLLPKLAERGFTCEIREQSPELVRLFIRHA